MEIKLESACLKLSEHDIMHIESSAFRRGAGSNMLPVPLNYWFKSAESGSIENLFM